MEEWKEGRYDTKREFSALTRTLIARPNGEDIYYYGRDIHSVESLPFSFSVRLTHSHNVCIMHVSVESERDEKTKRKVFGVSSSANEAECELAVGRESDNPR